MEQTNSTRLFHTPEISPIIQHLRNIMTTLRVEAVPSFDEMMDSSPEPYPYTKSFEQARDDPIVVLHSSGSTGMYMLIYMLRQFD